jgi:ABC-type glycerol-3-phosphate transport system substrate-binding protein
LKGQQQHKGIAMRILPVAMIGLALLAGCAGGTQRSAAPATQPMAASGATSTMSSPTQGDAIDRFAAAFEQERGRRY